ncbi:deoxyribonuclease-2-like protein [Euroglyphus maynei]|uniref:Deoxyribonuclease-2-like protein n=1 Tax=Euroglyphus maynei TaxID=6958 RepID=A0A1Y3BHY1_EURMA|nr:deoxyribonuclease-2-like protein [Euroglyphus maynei]
MHIKHRQQNIRMDESQSIFGRTFSTFFSENRTHLTTMFYNDQPPDGHDVPSSYAHAKGMIVADQHQGFWLIHTVPKFMPADNKYSYPATGGRYGQVALCISLSSSELAKVVNENFLLSRPFVYHMHIDSATEGTDLGKALVELEQHKWIKSKNYTQLNLKSMEGESFQSFYKNPSYHVDLYAKIVAKLLGTSLRVETWRHNPGNPLESECTNKNAEVENVKKIQVKFIDSDLQGNFSYYDDHSKWAITRDHTHDLVCIGDINRVESQFHRGGGTTCLTIANVWNNFNSFIEAIERCPDDIVENTTKSSHWWELIIEKTRAYFNRVRNQVI